MTAIKISVSSKWTKLERAALQAAIEIQLSELRRQHAEWKKAIAWEAPCFAENKGKQVRLQELIDTLSRNATFLEANRGNFSEFLED